MISRPRKKFAQHWLRSETVLQQIIEAARLEKSDRVLEIGPGTGILTRRLVAEVESVVAVEIDRDLCKQLVKSLGDRENFLLIEGDFLSIDLNSLLVDFPRFQNQNKVVANIPYNITGPIIEKLLGTIARPSQAGYESIVLLVQKEVAERLYARPRTKAFGALSVRVQYLASCELICNVPASAFYPAPKVDSAVVRLNLRTLPAPTENPRFLETLLKLGFSSRRKMLRNNLKGTIDLEQIDRIMEKLNINPQARAEDLSLEEWIALTDRLNGSCP